jgi:hypothetical protein
MLVAVLLLAAAAAAQTRAVLPGELELTVSLDPTDHPRLRGEMVLITIRGVYRRHITRESLRQPDLEGFDWAQLGPDTWKEERLGGETVKVFTRRMALYPAREGRLSIGAFSHDLTLTDEGDDWFEHSVASAPVSLDVAPAPETEGWWFPVRRLQISDEWSNAPDQLAPGEGVLRVIRIEALGATPQMIPPMPELTSPSAMIFPHPEQRFAELSPEGPVTYAFWRWTIRPTNDISAIVEPLTLSYFDTFHRQMRVATISPQRVAYAAAPPNPTTEASGVGMPAGPARLPGRMAALLGLTAFACGLAATLGRRRWAGLAALRRLPGFDPLAGALRRAARAGDVQAMRRLARQAEARDGPTPARASAIRLLDLVLFSRQPAPLPDAAELRRLAGDIMRR